MKNVLVIESEESSDKIYQVLLNSNERQFNLYGKSNMATSFPNLWDVIDFDIVVINNVSQIIFPRITEMAKKSIVILLTPTITELSIGTLTYLVGNGIIVANIKRMRQVVLKFLK